VRQPGKSDCAKQLRCSAMGKHSASSDRPEREQFFNPRAHCVCERLAIGNSHTARLDRPPDTDAHSRRPYDRTPLPHRRRASLNGHWHDGDLRFERHQERAALERQQRARTAAGALWERQKRIACPQRRG
jgi:hypothetical protein